MPLNLEHGLPVSRMDLEIFGAPQFPSEQSELFHGSLRFIRSMCSWRQKYTAQQGNELFMATILKWKRQNLRRTEGDLPVVKRNYFPTV